MPSYQQAAFLEEAVHSVLDQEGVEVELLVMDPGSCCWGSTDMKCGAGPTILTLLLT